MGQLEQLKETIRKEGRVLPGGIVKVDGFLNHKIDVALIEAFADYMAEHFAKDAPNAVLTIEASGIALAYAVARRMELPLIFAKKGQARNIGDDVYKADIHSFTRGIDYAAFVSKAYLGKGDRVLIVDDFLANGQAALGLISICEQAGAAIAGVAIAIEKAFQPGGALLRDKGVNLHSAVVVERIDDGCVYFTES